MNVLQILPALDIGGVETGTVDLARYLAARGHKAVVISAGGRLVKDLERCGVRHYALPVGRKSPFSILRMIGAVADVIRREEIDIVHARSRVPALIAYAASVMTGRIFITTAHGRYSRGLISTVMGWGRYVIVASNNMAKYMEHEFGVPHGRLRLIPRGVDLAQFAFRLPAAERGAAFSVGMVSRITPLKGHADFIRAVAALAREVPGLKAVIIGSAPKDKYLEDLKILVHGLGLSRIVTFAGATADVPSALRGLDLLVSATATHEAFGRSLIEAQACGVPVVATKVGGVVDVVEDGVTGLLCLPQNPADIAAKMLRLYHDPDLCRDLARRARQRVEERYTVDLMMERTLAVYRESLERQHILVIKMSAMGDVILSIPSLKALRARYPAAVIKVLVGLRAREALSGCPYIDDVIVCDLRGKHRGYPGLWRLGKTLRAECFDTVIDLQNNRASHLLAYLSLAPWRYGYANGKWSFFLNRSQKDDAPFLDPLEHQFRTLRLAGVKPAEKVLELWPSTYDDAQVDAFLTANWIKPGQDLVGIQVRASSRWYSKNWPPSSIAHLCDRLARELRVRAVLTGAKEDAAVAAHIMKLTRSKPINAVGRTDLLELASLLRRFKVFITPDSAPLHVACAMKVPFIALFGPTDPRRHLVPSSSGEVLCRKEEFPCCPCYKPVCPRTATCMKRISVDDVFAAVKRQVRTPDEDPLRIDSL